MYFQGKDHTSRVPINEKYKEASSIQVKKDRDRVVLVLMVIMMIFSRIGIKGVW